MDFEVQDLIIVDNFYTNPDEVRDFALTLPYREDVFAQHFWRSVAIINEDVIPHLEYYTKSKILMDEFWETPDDYTHYTEMNMSFYRVVNETGSEPRANHIHHDNADWSGILYLSPDIGPEQGTQFWRHKSSGDEYAFGNTGYVREEWKFDERCNISEDFEKTDYVSYKYNRLTLFRGTKFHSACFPNNIQDGERLNQFFYFNVEV